MTDNPLLEVRRLGVTYHTRRGEVKAVRDISFSLNAGERLGIVGESGSGKTQTAMALLGLNDANARVHGSIAYRGTELVGAGRRTLAGIRGREVAMIFQNPMSALNPHLRIGTQMTEVLRCHRGMGRHEARVQAIAMLQAAGIPDATRRVDRYPHEFSGGMCQRVMVAMALLASPRLLIADEPTTALDVTVQAQILALIEELRQRTGAALILISHDLGVVAGHCDRMLVMEAGVVRETGVVDDVFATPAHPYTRKLLAAVPRLEIAS